jgi:WXG100 family type VII secretion target
MPQAIVDPEELRQFAQNLKKFNGEVQQRISMLGNQLNNLSKTWRDQENKKFAEVFEQQMKSIARFVELTESHIPYLLRKAELIEEYLQQR